MPPPSPAESSIDPPVAGESGQALETIVEEEVADFGGDGASSDEKEAGGDEDMPQAETGLPS
eukprot:2009747-Alexandrium_andersonii.AAC.1